MFDRYEEAHRLHVVPQDRICTTGRFISLKSSTIRWEI